MAPSGDPSAFTFTFDAFPGIEENNKDVLFTLEIYDHEDEKLTIDTTGNVTSVILNGEVYTVNGTTPKLTPSETTFTLTAGTDTVSIPVAYTDDNEGFTDLINFYSKESTAVINLTEGTTTRLYII